MCSGKMQYGVFLVCVNGFYFAACRFRNLIQHKHSNLSSCAHRKHYSSKRDDQRLLSVQHSEPSYLITTFNYNRLYVNDRISD